MRYLMIKPDGEARNTFFRLNQFVNPWNTLSLGNDGGRPQTK